MAKSRTVVRTYWSKKKNQYVTKTYTYAHPSKKGLTLVDKNGRVMNKNVERFKQAILDNTDYSEAKKRTLLADLNATIKQRKSDKNRLTTSGFLGKQESNDIVRFLTNAGYSVDEFAEELEISIDDVLDTSNWNNGIFMGIYKFNWTYTGNFVERI